MIRVAVVGVGRWGRNHVRVLKELEHEGIARLVAIYDVDTDRAKSIASAFSVENVASSLRELADLGVEAAVIATPIDTLAAVASKLVEMGMHVLVEKPVATRSEEIERLIKLVESKGVIAMPGYIMRFSPVIRELKKVASQVKVHYAVFRRLSRRPPAVRKYSILLDLTVHDVDLCRYIVARDSCTVEKAIVVDAGIDRIVIAMLDCGNAKCLIHTDGLSLAKVREVELICEEVFVRANTDENTIKVSNPDKSYVERRVVGEEPLKAEDRAFVEACEGRRVEIPTLIDALETLRIVEQIEKASTKHF